VTGDLASLNLSHVYIPKITRGRRQEMIRYANPNIELLSSFEHSVKNLSMGNQEGMHIGADNSVRNCVLLHSSRMVDRCPVAKYCIIEQGERRKHT
jgi:hypothetical protein